MSESESVISVALYIHGENMLPERISEASGLIPTLTRRKGDVRATSTGKSHVVKTGLWGLVLKLPGLGVTDHLSELLKIIESCPELDFWALDGVAGAYIDVFISPETTLSELNFGMDKEHVLTMSKHKLSIEFTISADYGSP